MASRCFQLALLAGCALAGLGACNRQGGGELPIGEYPNVHYTTGDQWFGVKQSGQLSGTGWVLLPAPQESGPYVSNIDPYVKGFVRPEVCGECHQGNYESFLHTAHYLTAQEATKESVLGSFAAGENELETREAGLRFEMKADEQGMRQCLSVEHAGRIYTHEASFDIVTGSGNHGQSYLSWRENELFQLPVSYFSEIDGWVNSPGLYTDGTADFARGIGDRCLDCHATYFDKAPGSFNAYDRSNYILGVTCVRCHGPGWAHVQYHKHHPEESAPRYIVNPSTLSQQRANEICAQCHSGAGRLKQPAFTYTPGKPLEEYIELDFSGENPENDDPHAANQLARLMKSRCFTESGEMTCFTCHDPHQHERGDLPLFAQRCMRCHEVDHCGLANELGDSLQRHCVVCHMPSRRDAHGLMETPQGGFLPLLHDHYIQAQPAGTKQLVDELRAELLQAMSPAK